MKTSRVSVTLPHEVALLYSNIADRLGISRSSLMSSLLVDAVDELALGINALLSAAVDCSPTDAPLRVRGASIDLIRQKVDDLQALVDELENSGQRGLL